MRQFPSLLLLSSVILLGACQKTPVPDTTAPSVVLDVTPARVNDSGTVTLKATASDNKAVTQVSFYRGTTLLSTDTAAPFEATDTVNAQTARSVTYRAVATDAAGNKGEATADLTLTFSSVAGTVKEGQITERADGSLALTTSAWTGGAGAVKLEGYDPNGGTSVTLSSGTLTADGQFTLALPAVGANLLQPLNVDMPECQGVITVSNPTAKVASADVYVDAGKDGRVAPVELISATNDALVGTTGLLIYVDQDVTFNGEHKCTFGTYKYDNLRLFSGWNKVLQKDAFSATEDSVTYSSAAWPTNWVYFDQSSTGLNAQRLSLPAKKPSFFR